MKGCHVNEDCWSLCDVSVITIAVWCKVLITCSSAISKVSCTDLLELYRAGSVFFDVLCLCLFVHHCILSYHFRTEVTQFLANCAPSSRFICCAVWLLCFCCISFAPVLILKEHSVMNSFTCYTLDLIPSLLHLSTDCTRGSSGRVQ